MQKLTVILSAIAVSGSALVYSAIGQAGSAQPLLPEDTGAVGRYQFIHIQEQTETTLWMIDTCTGRIWRRYAYNDGDHWTQTIREDYPAAAVRLQGMPPKPPASK